MHDIAVWLARFKEQLSVHGNAHPWILFVALVILPGFGFPVSALLVLAGVIWGTSWSSCAIALLAIALNMIWTHWLAAGPARALVIKWLGHRWERWKNLPRADLVKLACMLRVTPGIPLFVQNYTLGLLKVPLGLYLSVSLPLTGLYAIGFVLTGGAIFEGRAGLAISGIGVLIAALVLLRFIRSRVSNNEFSKGE